MNGISDFWKLVEELSIIEASLLIIGEEPQLTAFDVEHYDAENQPHGYQAVKSAIIIALQNNSLTGSLSYLPVSQPDGVPHRNESENKKSINQVNLFESKVEAASLKQWLAERDFDCPYIGLQKASVPSFKDVGNPKYAPKLAAIIEAWEQTPLDAPGGTPKQRIMKWLRLNASRFELVQDDGNPSEHIIEELAKVANWAPGGGAPRTNSSTTNDEPDPHFSP